MSHKPLCIIWNPISYYFFGFDLLGPCPSPAARSHTAQQHMAPHFLRLTGFPKALWSVLLLGVLHGTVLSHKNSLSRAAHLCLLLIFFKYLFKCPLVNEALP